MEFWSLEHVKYQKQLELNPGSHRGAWLQDSTYFWCSMLAESKSLVMSRDQTVVRRMAGLCGYMAMYRRHKRRQRESCWRLLQLQLPKFRQRIDLISY